MPSMSSRKQPSQQANHDDACLSLDEHMLHCGICSSADDACEIGERLMAAELDVDE